MSEKRTSIKELGEEYEKHAALQQSFIDSCKAQINRAEKSGDTDLVQKLKSDLRKLREIKKELEKTAIHLKNYYKGDS